MAYNSGALIYGSDGSLVEENQIKKGSHAFSIQHYENDIGKIKGRAFTPSSTTMSSLTVESYGVISNIILLEVISRLRPSNQGKPVIRIILDNKEVIKRCQEPPDVLNANQTMIPEYDS